MLSSALLLPLVSFWVTASTHCETVIPCLFSAQEPGLLSKATTFYPRRPFTLVDQVPPGSSFDHFRQQLQQAIRDRNAAFIRSIADPQIKLTFGLPITLNDLNIDRPNSLFWRQLERIMSVGCAPYEAPGDAPDVEAWQCPHVSQAALGDPFSDIYIVGTDVNVRAAPSIDSPVIDVLSNEVVRSDSTGFDRLTDQQREELQTLAGWQPILTPQGQHGYVSSRYAYAPAGYRARFENKQGRWQMTIFIAGD